MSIRRLCVVETDPNDPQYGALFGLNPNEATGIGIPAFRSGPTLPPAGMEGEAFLDSVSRQGYVWSGGKWIPIAKSPVTTYPTEAELLADNLQPAGAYGAAANSGNLFIKVASGWRAVGIRSYANTAALEADAAGDGALGIVLDDDTLWVRAGGKWRPETARVLPDLAAVKAWAINDGAEAIEIADGLSFTRVQGAWLPKSTWQVDTEVALLARTDMLKGQIAVAIDTGHRFLWNGTAWVGEPIRHYDTEAHLLADATAAEGILAWADDTGAMFTRRAGAWFSLGVDHASTFADLATITAPHQGQRVYIDAQAVMVHRVGAAWEAEGIWSADEAVILARNDVPENLIAVASDTGTNWQRRGTTWVPISLRTSQNNAAILADTTAPDRTVSVASDTGIIYIRIAGAWYPKTQWVNTEAVILASTWALDGQVAVARDTGHTFTRVGGQWIGSPIRHYATQAALLADTPADGTFAWADDTNRVYTRGGGAWNSTDLPPTGWAVDWKDDNWPKDSLVVVDGKIWRAKAAVLKGAPAPAEPAWEKVGGGATWETLQEWDNVAAGTRTFTPDWTKYSVYRIELFARNTVWIKSANVLTLTGVQTSDKIGGAGYSGDTVAATERQVVPDNWMFRGVWTFEKNNVRFEAHLHTDGSENIVVVAGGPTGLVGAFAVRWAGAADGRVMGLSK